MMKMDNLNPEQIKAVKHVDSPVLVFAGAGSGKTRVLTHKIAHLIENIGLPPENILAVTFTNKAAHEMTSRVHSIVKVDSSKLNIGTFHSISAGILRKHIHCLGFENNFTIYDQKDALSVVKKVIKNMDLDIKQNDPKYFYYMISRAKNQLISYKEMDKIDSGYVDKNLSEVYRLYQESLKDSNSLDFDDLLIFPLRIFKENDSLLDYYRRKFRYVLVDEYQDTNRPQFEFISLIAKEHQDICVVGDDDQSIYGWRGADVSNILDFNKSFDNPLVVKLEQNYRSTKSILNVANSVIKNNITRAEKSLWTDNEPGNSVVYQNLYNEKIEASKIVDIIQKKCNDSFSLNDAVILYRTNSQSRQIEDLLRRRSVPYNIIGGVKFYDRKEIKDVLSYLRYICNSNDEVSFLRILNFPPRGLGKTTINKVLDVKISGSKSLSDAITSEDLLLGQKQKESLKYFNELITKLRLASKELNAYELILELIKAVDFKHYYCSKNIPEDIDRWENVQELINSIQEFCVNSSSTSLQSFLEEVSLLTDIDRWNNNDECLTLMTVHSSKGLEFPLVFIAGMEEGLFPHSNSINDEESVEEERRLFYVAITRAMEELYLFSADSRMKFGGGNLPSLRSRFIDEIPKELIDFKNKSRDDSFASISKNSYNSNAEIIKKGNLVRHQLYGNGRVVNVDGIGENTKVTVIFSGNVQKKFIQRYANLKIIK